MKTVTATIPFMGFYESIHSQCVDDALEQCLDWEGRGHPDAKFTDKDLQNIYDALDYGKAYQTYAKLYAEACLRALNEALPSGAAIKWEFESMESPREYNFTTNRIFVTIPVGHLQTLREYAGDEYMQAALDARFTPCDGFRPFYNRDLEAWGAKPLDEYDHNEAGTVIEAAILSTLTKDQTINRGWDSFEGQVYTDYLNHQSPSAGDEAVEAGMGAEGWEIINRVRGDD